MLKLVYSTTYIKLIATTFLTFGWLTAEPGSVTYTNTDRQHLNGFITNTNWVFIQTDRWSNPGLFRDSVGMLSSCWGNSTKQGRASWLRASLSLFLAVSASNMLVGLFWQPSLALSLQGFKFQICDVCEYRCRCAHMDHNSARNPGCDIGSEPSDLTQWSKQGLWQRDSKCGQTSSDWLPHAQLWLWDSWPTRTFWHTNMKKAWLIIGGKVNRRVNTWKNLFLNPNTVETLNHAGSTPTRGTERERAEIKSVLTPRTQSPETWRWGWWCWWRFLHSSQHSSLRIRKGVTQTHHGCCMKEVPPPPPLLTCVPVVATAGPWQLCGEAVEEVEDGPGKDHNVVHV